MAIGFAPELARPGEYGQGSYFAQRTPLLVAFLVAELMTILDYDADL